MRWKRKIVVGKYMNCKPAPDFCLLTRRKKCRHWRLKRFLFTFHLTSSIKKYCMKSKVYRTQAVKTFDLDVDLDFGGLKSVCESAAQIFTIEWNCYLNITELKRGAKTFRRCNKQYIIAIFRLGQLMPVWSRVESFSCNWI